MTVRTWNGASAAFETAADWAPFGAPVPGDYALINSGIVSEGGLFPSFLTVRLQGSATSSPRLVLAGATIPSSSRLEVTGNGSSPSIVVQGQVNNLGTIAISSSAPGSATFLVRDAADGSATTFTNTGTIAVTDGVAQIVNFGGNATKMTNNGTVSVVSTGAAASTAYISTPVDGTGTLSIGRSSTLDLAAAVGSGQTVAFQPGGAGEALQLEAPASFNGVLSGFVSGDQIGLGAVPSPTLTYASTSATSGVLRIASGGTAYADLNLKGVYAASDFSVTSTDLGGGQSAAAISTTATTPAFGYTDTATNASGTVTPDLYSGPVNYLQYQYIWNSTDGVAMTANRSNVFLKGNSGADALAVTGGNNVVDGGAGSNFLVGGNGADGGTDTFFVDGRGGDVTWSSIVNFHHGDAVTIFGFTGGVSTLPLVASDGASGFTGATIHSELSGAGSGVNGSVTFVGVSYNDALDARQGGKFTYSFGSLDANTPYMNIVYTG